MLDNGNCDILFELPNEPRPVIVGNPNNDPVDDWSPEVPEVNPLNPDIGFDSCCMAMEVNADEGLDEENGIDDSCVNEGMP